jgi:hypothetical protein
MNLIPIIGDEDVGSQSPCGRTASHDHRGAIIGGTFSPPMLSD